MVGMIGSLYRLTKRRASALAAQNPIKQRPTKASVFGLQRPAMHLQRPFYIMRLKRQFDIPNCVAECGSFATSSQPAHRSSRSHGRSFPQQSHNATAHHRPCDFGRRGASKSNEMTKPGPGPLQSQYPETNQMPLTFAAIPQAPAACRQL